MPEYSKMLEAESRMQALLQGAGSEGALAAELVAHFRHGYPLENVRRLTRSDDARLVKAGAWVLSELGNKAASLLSEGEYLMKHLLPYARFFGLDVVLTCAGWQDGRALAQAVRMVDDPDAAVRWKATQFVSRASVEQLRAALLHLREEHAPEDAVEVLGVERLLGERQSLDAVASARGPIASRFEFAVALRTAPDDAAALRAAAGNDPEVRDWVEKELAFR